MFLYFFWLYATSPHRAALHNPPNDSSLVATANKHRPSSDNARFSLQPHFQAKSLSFYACSTAPLTVIGGSERLAKSPFLATVHLHFLVVCAPEFLHNSNFANELEQAVKINTKLNLSSSLSSRSFEIQKTYSCLSEYGQPQSFKNTSKVKKILRFKFVGPMFGFYKFLAHKNL